MDYRILGPLEVEVDGIEVDLGPRKQKSLFALLLINHGHTVSTDRILEALWGEDAQGKENALWVYVSRLRSVLGEVVSESVLLTRDHGYELRLGDDQLDADRFENLAREGVALRASDPAAAAETLRNALGLWRGHALEEFAYDDFAREEIRRLETLRDAALDARIEADLACGRGGELLGELEQLVESRPLDEQPVRHLMMALYRSGRQAEALRGFERFRRTLGEETGTEPSPELRRLEEQILFHDTRLARTVDDDRGVEGTPNPYKGLEAFGEDDAHLFFGRDAVTADILKRIDDHAIVTVVGPSGCGKSSVVRSGVVPAVRKGALPGSDRWHVATMIPGRHPFIELEAALLRSTLDAPSSLREHLDGSSDELLRAGLRVLPSDDTCLVIVIDQFEELFTLADEAITRRFLDAVVEASLDDRRRIRFVITLRADFYDRPLAHARFGSAMGAGIVNVVPMAPEELEQAASGPALRAGVRLEPGLEAGLIGDVLGQPGALPLFEFALTDLFDRRIGDTLTLEAYRTMGGIDGALSRKAEHLFAGLTHDQQAAAEQVFLRLVSLSDGDTRSRRRVEASELVSLDLDITELQAVLDSFGSQRLILFDRNDATGSPTVEVSHEALLEHWDRLAGWIASATDDLTTNARLTALAAEWHDHGEDPAYLLAEGRLTDYSTWAENSTMTLAGPERAYLEASRLAHEDREYAEAERAARETAIARRAKRTAWSFAAMVALVVVVGGYVAWAVTRPEGPTIAFVYSDEASGFQRSMADGFTRAAELHDFEPVDYVVETDPREQLRAIAQTNPRAVIASVDMVLHIAEVAPEFPDVVFVVIDGAPWAEIDNVYSVTFDDMTGGHIAGVIAGLATTTGRVAFIGPGQFASSELVARSFVAGVGSASDAKPQVGWISAGMVAHPTWGYMWDGFSRPDLAEALAADLFREGVDVIYAWAGEAADGVVRAAQAHEQATGEQVWVIAPDNDGQLLPEQEAHILTSIIKRFDEAVVVAVESILSPDPMESIELPLYQLGAGPVDALAAEAESVLAASSPDVATELVWSTVPYRWPEDPAAERLVSVSQSRCEVDDPGPVNPTEPIAFTIVNSADTSVTVGLAMVSADLSEGERERIDSSASGWVKAVAAGLVMPTYSVEVPPGRALELRSEFLDEGSGFGMGGLQCWWNDGRASDPVFFDVVPGG